MSDAADEAIGILVLAAGAAVRMGRPKQLLPYRGHSLLLHAVAVALDTPYRPVCVVLGAHATRLAEEIRHLPVLPVTHERWEAGMGSSIRAGIEAVLAAKPDLAGIVIMLCDQPLLTHETIHRLVEAARTTHRSIAASRYGGAVGVPAFFSADCFSRLCSLSDAEGAKSLIREYAPRTEVIDVPEAALDIDMPEDYARLIDPVLSDPPAGS